MRSFGSTTSQTWRDPTGLEAEVRLAGNAVDVTDSGQPSLPVNRATGFEPRSPREPTARSLSRFDHSPVTPVGCQQRTQQESEVSSGNWPTSSLKWQTVNPN